MSEESTARAWMDRIRSAEKKLKPWREECRKIFRRYRGKEEGVEAPPVINIHWSNMQMYLATVYARTPKPEVVRRIKGDPLGQQLAEMVRDALAFSVDEYDFDEVMESVLVDYGNAGLGQTRIVYKPYFNDTQRERTPVTPNEELRDGRLSITYVLPDGSSADASKVKAEGDALFVEGKMQQEVVYEEVCVDFIPWDRFGWDTDAALWPEVKWAYIKHNLTKKQVRDRFKVDPDHLGTTSNEFGGGKAGDDSRLIGEYIEVFELFDKVGRKVMCLCEGREKPLETLDDPYQLEHFFPFPKPLLATTTSDKLIPVPLYVIVQDLYEDLNECTRRIRNLVKMLRVRGAYDARYKESLQNILTADDGALVPIDGWSEHMEKSGLKGAVDTFPLEDIYGALQTLVNYRKELINLIYEITGFSDIARGATRASESAAAQKIKNEYMSVRINREVRKVARYVRDVFRLIAEMQCEQFDATTYAAITGKQVTEADLQALRSDITRGYKIDVETDSMILDDETAEMERRASAINSISQFIQAWAPLAQSGMMSGEVVKQIGMYLTGATVKGRELEKYMEQLNIQPPPPPEQEQPDQSAQINAQVKMQEIQAKAQSDAAKMAADREIKMAEIASNEKIERERIGSHMLIERAKIENDQMKTMLAAGKDPNTGESHDMQLVERMMQSFTEQMAGVQSAGQQGNMALLQALASGNADMVKALRAPKRVVRDEKTGKAVGVTSED